MERYGETYSDLNMIFTLYISFYIIWNLFNIVILRVNEIFVLKSVDWKHINKYLHTMSVIKLRQNAQIKPGNKYKM